MVALGGLHIIGTERHEARRIDNQLRGRAGRQGDPGSSRFYLSLQDDLMRIFGSDRISGLMQRLGMEEGVPIEHGMVTKAIERAQKQVEAQNFSVRKHLLEYDDVMNKQRESIYGLRRELLEGKIKITRRGRRDRRHARYLMTLGEELARRTVETYAQRGDRPGRVGPRRAEARVTRDLRPRQAERIARLRRPHAGRDDGRGLGAGPRDVREEGSADRRAAILHRVERDIMLQIVDAQWKDHLYSLDHLKEGIGLRGYGQRDPLVEYKKESFDLFTGDEGSHRRGDRPLPVALVPVVGEEGPGVPAVRRPRRGARRR